MKNRRKRLEYVRSPQSLPIAEDVQACHIAYGNVYEMVMMAAARSRDVARGAAPMVENGSHKPVVTALLEVAAGKVDKDYLNNK